MRQKRNAKLNAILDEFRGLDRWAAAANDPVKHRRRNIAKQASPDEFAEFLADIFGAECTLRYMCSGRRDGDISTRRVPPFEMAVLQDALKHLRIGKSADGDGLVVEVVTRSSFSLDEKLLEAYNKMLATGRYEPSWYHTDFIMIPKKGELASNWVVEDHV